MTFQSESESNSENEDTRVMRRGVEDALDSDDDPTRIVSRAGATQDDEGVEDDATRVVRRETSALSSPETDDRTVVVNRSVEIADDTILSQRGERGSSAIEDATVISAGNVRRNRSDPQIRSRVLARRPEVPAGSSQLVKKPQPETKIVVRNDFGTPAKQKKVQVESAAPEIAPSERERRRSRRLSIALLLGTVMAAALMLLVVVQLI